MAEALRSLSYEGTLVYLHGNRLESLRVVHRIENRQIQEHLVALNGPIRTLVRGKSGVACKLSAPHSVSVPGRGLGKDIFHARKPDLGVLQDHYQIHPLGEARVAGRFAEVVGVTPRDRLRYGYRFYLDRESGLPLKSDLTGQQTDPIEQVMFTSLDLLPSRRAESTADPMPRQGRYGPEPPIPDSLPWRFDTLPPGFSLVMHNDWRPAGGQPVDHFVLSDGLASVSVYVEADNPREGLEGDTHIGAVHRRQTDIRSSGYGRGRSAARNGGDGAGRYSTRARRTAMIEETGRVISVQGDLAEVEGQPRSGCGSCAVKGTCGTSLLARYFGPRRLLMRAHNPIGARPGEQVVIGLSEGSLLEASVLAYLVPLLAMIGGAVAGAFVAERLVPTYTQILSAMTGLGGLAAALAWLVGFIRARSLDERYRPRILRRLSIGSGESPTASSW